MDQLPPIKGHFSRYSEYFFGKGFAPTNLHHIFSCNMNLIWSSDIVRINNGMVAQMDNTSILINSLSKIKSDYKF